MKSNTLFDITNYTNTNAGMDTNSTMPSNPTNRKEDNNTADDSATNAISPITNNTTVMAQTVDDYINGKVTVDDLISTFNDAVEKVMTGIDEAKGKVFLTIVDHTPDHLAQTTYAAFIADKPERKRFIGKSEYHALRNYYERYNSLPKNLQEYVDKSTLTNAKCALNIADYSADKLAQIKKEYPNGIPNKKEFGRLFLPPPQPKVEKPKGKARNMSLLNIKQVNNKYRTFANRAIKSFAETHGCSPEVVQALRSKFIEFDSAFSSILADLDLSAKRTKELKGGKEEK